jgi:hypothetical protein
MFGWLQPRIAASTTAPTRVPARPAAICGTTTTGVAGLKSRSMSDAKVGTALEPTAVATSVAVSPPGSANPPDIPEALGGLETAAILGLFVVFLRFRGTRKGAFAFVLWLLIVGRLAYYVVRGYSEAAIAFLGQSVPAWQPFAMGLMLGFVVAALTLYKPGSSLISKDARTDTGHENTATRDMASEPGPAVRVPVASPALAVPAVIQAPRPRPRLVLTYSDNGKAVQPRDRRIWLENRGDADAHDVRVDDIVLDGRTIRCNAIPFVRTGSPPQELTCETENAAGQIHALFDRTLGEALASSVGAYLDRQPFNMATEMLEEGGFYSQEVVVRCRDYDRMDFVTTFSARYMWTLGKFEDIRIVGNVPAPRNAEAG